MAPKAITSRGKVLLQAGGPAREQAGTGGCSGKGWREAVSRRQILFGVRSRSDSAAPIPQRLPGVAGVTAHKPTAGRAGVWREPGREWKGFFLGGEAGRASMRLLSKKALGKTCTRRHFPLTCPALLSPPCRYLWEEPDPFRPRLHNPLPGPVHNLHLRLQHRDEGKEGQHGNRGFPRLAMVSWGRRGCTFTTLFFRPEGGRRNFISSNRHQNYSGLYAEGQLKMLPLVSPTLHQPQNPLTAVNEGAGPATFSPPKAEQDAVNQGWAPLCSRNINSRLSSSTGGAIKISPSSFPPPGHFFDMRLRHRVHDLREIPENV